MNTWLTAKKKRFLRTDYSSEPHRKKQKNSNLILASWNNNISTRTPSRYMTYTADLVTTLVFTAEMAAKVATRGLLAGTTIVRNLTKKKTKKKLVYR